MTLPLRTVRDPQNRAFQKAVQVSALREWTYLLLASLGAGLIGLALILLVVGQRTVGYNEGWVAGGAAVALEYGQLLDRAREAVAFRDSVDRGLLVPIRLEGRVVWFPE